jgi:hypothetical protein
MALTARTNTDLGIQSRCTEPIETLLESRPELEELYAGLLVTQPNRPIEFCDTDLKALVP